MQDNIFPKNLSFLCQRSQEEWLLSLEAMPLLSAQCRSYLILRCQLLSLGSTLGSRGTNDLTMGLINVFHRALAPDLILILIHEGQRCKRTDGVCGC